MSNNASSQITYVFTPSLLRKLTKYFIFPPLKTNNCKGDKSVSGNSFKYSKHNLKSVQNCLCKNDKTLNQKLEDITD